MICGKYTCKRKEQKNVIATTTPTRKNHKNKHHTIMCARTVLQMETQENVQQKYINRSVYIGETDISDWMCDTSMQLQVHEKKNKHCDRLFFPLCSETEVIVIRNFIDSMDIVYGTYAIFV